MWWSALHSHKLHWDSWGDNQPHHDIKFLCSLFVKIMAIVSLKQSRINNKAPARQNPKEELSKPARGQQLVFPAATGHEWHQETCLGATGWKRTEGWESEKEKHGDKQSLVEDTHRGDQRSSTNWCISLDNQCARLNGLKYFCLCTDHEQMQLYF